AASASAQERASIVGVVQDASGAVQPGVTVEAATDALIERVRSGITDGAAAQALLTAAQVPKRTLNWAFGFPDVAIARAQPAIVGGRPFVGTGAASQHVGGAAAGHVAR